MARLRRQFLPHVAGPAFREWSAATAIAAVLALPWLTGLPAAVRAAEPAVQEPPEPVEPGNAASAAAAAAGKMDEAIGRAARESRPKAGVPTVPGNTLQGAAVPDDLLVARVSAEVAAKQLEARRVAQKSPSDALALLDNAAALAYQHVHAPMPALPERLSGYQPIIDRLMAKRPEDRFASARELFAYIAH